MIHLATVPFQECEHNPLLASKIIIDGFHRLLKHAKEYSVKRLIMASSSEVYGLPSQLPIRETTSLKPLSVYGFLKTCADLHALERAESWELPICILRFFNLYGSPVEGPLPKTVLYQFAGQILRDEPIILHASLQNSRDFLHVQDAARALVLAIQHEEAEGVINVGSGNEVYLREAACRLSHRARRHLQIDCRPNEGRLRRAVADIRRARQKLGFAPKVSLDQGLREVLDGVSHEIGNLKKQKSGTKI